MRVRLTIEIEYDQHTASDDDIKRVVGNIPSRAAGEGLFTEGTDATVKTWYHEVEVIDGEGDVVFSDGSYLEYPDDDGRIRRRDENGNSLDWKDPGDEGWDEWADYFRPFIRDQFDNGSCPDCEEPIPYDMEDGGECPECGHVFHSQEAIDEQIRRDEKHGLYGDKQDPAN